MRDKGKLLMQQSSFQTGKKARSVTMGMKEGGEGKRRSNFEFTTRCPLRSSLARMEARRPSM